MDRSILRVKDSYIVLAATHAGVDLNKAAIEEKLKIFRSVMRNIEFAIREARTDGILSEQFTKKDIRPEFKYILGELREFLEQKPMVNIPGGLDTVKVVMQHLETAISHLNAAARMYEIAHKSNDDAHWFGYEERYRKCAECLMEAQDQLETSTLP